jgi:hypothetical protein
MSVVYALIVTIVGVAFALLVIPYLGSLFYPSYLK